MGVFCVFSSAGEVEFQRAVPDTLTTWVASAFAVSNSTGLGVGELKPQVGIQKGIENSNSTLLLLESNL